MQCNAGEQWPHGRLSRALQEGQERKGTPDSASERRYTYKRGAGSKVKRCCIDLRPFCFAKPSPASERRVSQSAGLVAECWISSRE